MIQQFAFHKTGFEGCFLIDPFFAEDERGLFIKDYSKEVFAQNNIHHELKEVFYTQSHKGVIRGIHFQRVNQQAKLVRCVVGSIFDVVVDLKPKSKTFGRWAGFYLNEENKKEVLVPAHFGHGYMVLEPSVVSYKCDEKFYGEYDDGIIWNDKDIGIEWPMAKIDDVILSEKDSQLQTFNTYKKHHD